MQLNKQHIVVLGAGESGLGAARLAKAKGHDVFVSDYGSIKDSAKKMLQKLHIEFEEGQHSLEKILQADLVVKSPGISDRTSIIQNIRFKKIPVISEIEFAARYTEKPIVAITGTNGKTTTTSLTHHLMAQELGARVAVGGNIGTSFAGLVVNDDNYDWYVLEISSFQLEDIQEFHPIIAAVLNITPDHLDRYEDGMKGYAYAKFRIAAQQTKKDFFLLNIDDSGVNEYRQYSNWNSKTIMLEAPKSNDDIWVDRENYILGDNLKGPHNWFNAKFAIRIARLAGISAKAIKQGLSTFKNAPHRLEYVGAANNIAYINDSKATNIESTKQALKAMDQPTIWIVGGEDKGNNYSDIEDLVRDRVRAIVCLGADNYKLFEAFAEIDKPIVETKSAKDAVHAATDLAEEGDVVLLSPACASFDLFKNYMDRGDQFKAAVQKIIENTQKPNLA